MKKYSSKTTSFFAILWIWSLVIINSDKSTEKKEETSGTANSSQNKQLERTKKSSKTEGKEKEK